MALEHEFAIIGNENTNFIDEYEDIVKIPDYFYCYIKDSFLWFNSMHNNVIEKKGLPYYGVATIKLPEIKKLMDIIISWKFLFGNATEEIALTCDYLLDEKKYEINVVKKNVLLKYLRDLEWLCNKALTMGKMIVYNGI